MIKKISLFIILGLSVLSCTPEEGESFQETEEDCGCDEVDTTSANQK